MKTFTKAAIAKMMDQAVLKPDATDDDIRRNADLCRRLGIGCLCVRPADVRLAADCLRGSGVTVAAVIGFPHGAERTEVKGFAAQLAIEDGAAELDMVMNIGKLRSGDDAFVERDIRAVVGTANHGGAKVKVILETCLLTPDEIVRACGCAVRAGAAFVKTSTGFSKGGATPEAVTLMLRAVAGHAQVKASGGIHTWAEAVHYAEMGCTRLGVSGAEKILSEEN